MSKQETKSSILQNESTNNFFNDGFICAQNIKKKEGLENMIHLMTSLIKFLLILVFSG